MIKDLEIGKAYTCTLALLECSKQKTKAGKDYLRLSLTDGQETVVGNYWDWAGGDNLPPVNTVYVVTCNVGEWAGAKQLNVSKMVTDPNTDLNSFRPRIGPYDLVLGYYDEALYMIDNMEHPVLRAVCMDIYQGLKDAWLTIPAAKGIHHAYVAGNLIHCVNVAKLAASMAHSLKANIDLCVAGALLHDVGKLLTYKWDGIRIDMTPYGQLVDHIVLGMNVVSGTCTGLGVPANIEMLLTHIIASHHGKKEYGSPVEPKCIEALIVHNADKLDADVEIIRAASSTDSVWTNKLFTLGNNSFLTEACVEKILEAEELDASWEDDVAECMQQEPSII